MYRWECLKCKRLCKCKHCKSENCNDSEVVNVGELVKHVNNNNTNVNLMHERYAHIHPKVVSHQHIVCANNRDELSAMPKFVEINNKYLVYEIDDDNEADSNKYSINGVNTLLLNKTKCEMHYYYHHHQQPSSSLPACSLCAHQASTPNDLLYFESFNSFLCYLQSVFTVSPYEKILNTNIPFFLDNKHKFLSYLSRYLKSPYTQDVLSQPACKTLCKLCLLKHINAPNGYDKLAQDLWSSSSSSNFIFANSPEHTHPMYMGSYNQQIPFYICDDYYNDALFYNYLNNFIYSNYFSGDASVNGFPKVLSNYTKIHLMQINSALIVGITELAYWLFEIIQESKERLCSSRIDGLAKQFYIKRDMMLKKCESFRMVFNEYSVKLSQLEKALKGVEVCMNGKDVDMKEFDAVKAEFAKEREVFKENVNEFDIFCSSLNMMCVSADYHIIHLRNIIESIKVCMAGRPSEQANNHMNSSNNSKSRSCAV